MGRQGRKLRYKLRPLDVAPLHVIADVPYFSQWESHELVGRILDGTIKAEDDPKWRESGAEDKAEYTSWSWSACGMACTKMILAHSTAQVVPIVTLGKKALEYGCYDLPLETSAGLKYEPYVRFVQQELGWRAKVISPMIKDDIVRALSMGYYVIASVSPDIRVPTSQPKHRGGHLVLVVAYDLDKKNFYINNPSGNTKATQEHARVSFAEFEKFFAHRGIIIDADVI